ncbi:MAG: ATP-binding cassette domain-containing protein [Actinobacteria bacterium]|nr:ATP-binding cassette domain-containing protein [Actinomycetota bacterium]
MDGVRVQRRDRATGSPVTILGPIDWIVRAGEQWAVLGPNGSGKSTLLSLAGAVDHPTSGRVDVLGERLGSVDVRALRTRIGHVTTDVSDTWRRRMTIRGVVETGATGTIALAPPPSPAVRERSDTLLALFTLRAIAERPFAHASVGEQQRARIARALMTGPALMLLDEPNAGLDLAGRELQLRSLTRATLDDGRLTTITVTHHLEEIAPTTTHALLLRTGRIVAAGPIDEALTSDSASACFGLALRVERRSGRFAARASLP